MNFIAELTAAFEANANPLAAVPMENYLKNHFKFLGLKTGPRRELFKAIWKKHQAEITANPRGIAWALYGLEPREFHYCAIEILIKELKKKYRKDDIIWIEKLLVTHAWWDSVDTISKYILGQYLLEFPEQVPGAVARFSASENFWLNRSTLLFQLGYRDKTDAGLLFAQCRRFSDVKEFFIRKAIGWALREYGRYDPQAVRDFVKVTCLSPLSQKEALKNIGQS